MLVIDLRYLIESYNYRPQVFETRRNAGYWYSTKETRHIIVQRKLWNMIKGSPSHPLKV